MKKEQTVNKGQSSLTSVFLLFCFGIFINFVGARLANRLGLPLYLDNLGSATAAAVGGYIPGILIASVSNLLTGIKDVNNIYYGFLTILIAICSAWFAKRGFYSRLSRLPVIILTFSFIGGILGSLLTMALYGNTFGTGLAGDLALYFYNHLPLSTIPSQLLADLVADLADKTITVLVTALTLKLLPRRVKERLYLGLWDEPLAPEKERRSYGPRSLRGKIILLVGLSTLVTTITVTTISFLHFRNDSFEDQVGMAKGICITMQEYIDAERIDEFLEKGYEAKGYKETISFLTQLRSVSERIKFCYVYRIERDGCHVVFDPDTPSMKGTPPGEVIPFDEAFEKYLPRLLTGQKIPPVISKGSYGWLLTVYEPLFDKQGHCQCYTAVDISMNHIHVSGFRFLTRVLAVFLCFFMIILTISIWFAENRIISPINRMAAVSRDLSFDDETSCTESLKRLEGLNVNTRDEIENLFQAIVRTTESMVNYTIQTREQNELISRLQNGLIMVLADMVESRDENTGEHVRKTAAYTEIIMKELKKEGIYTDQLTDEFMSDVFNSAPLHDVGKIHIPDAILNKPGKLTPEEFDIMKTHTTAGSEIITQAMSTVSDSNSSYLMEAKNLAHYHHEKWNGKGYPCGLAGEEIPLSARIMAVADVFDALVSKRSYKQGFSFETAMDIIRKDSGTHFDPYVAGAFLNASEEVRRVMESNLSRDAASLRSQGSPES